MLSGASILIVEPSDDLHQLKTERMMVHHREMELWTCRVMNAQRGGYSLQDEREVWRAETTAA